MIHHVCAHAGRNADVESLCCNRNKEKIQMSLRGIFDEAISGDTCTRDMLNLKQQVSEAGSPPPPDLDGLHPDY